MKFPIADLHCDLLLYLNGSKKRTAFHPEVRGSIPQMREGNVFFQALPIFVMTQKGSSQLGAEQFAIYQSLPYQYPNDFEFYEGNGGLDKKSSKIKIMLAIENASAIAEEDEKLSLILERFSQMIDRSKILYMSLTWNMENRFGGGAATNVGLKDDGKRLLDFMHGKKIAIDLSHTSDALGYDIFDYIDAKNLDIPIIASHSNFRTICDVPRNLPDGLAKEILRRDGIIGLNFISSFIGAANPNNFVKHLDYMLQLNGANQVCFGADFFCLDDLPEDQRKPVEDCFFDEYDHAGTYGKLLELYKKRLGVSDTILEGIAHKNFSTFVRNNC